MMPHKNRGYGAVKAFFVQMRISLTAVLSLAFLVCGVYPLLVWAAGQTLFPHEAGGSLVRVGGSVAGSSLIGQGFTGADYFHPRPSAAGSGYDAAASGGSNLGPTSRQLIEAVRSRIAAYRAENGLPADVPIPADAVTASASGLDPHISVPNALNQARRVARARGIAEEALRERIAARTEGRTFGIFGEPRVNVLMLNLDLDPKR
ncbi:MAG: K(+)-transporting ATPase subunit C [Deltaproteobacteria bacterium]|nr:K(+)-transporting ATPase subunit C [Deltaproteobacteria bacterium]